MNEQMEDCLFIEDMVAVQDRIEQAWNLFGFEGKS